MRGAAGPLACGLIIAADADRVGVEQITSADHGVTGCTAVVADSLHSAFRATGVQLPPL